METVLKTNSIVKTYKKVNVVDNVSISVTKGSIYGLIGKNGAGKTTIMRMIVGLAYPNSGSITLFENDNLLDGQKKIGCVIENPALFPHMTARDNLLYYNKLLGIKNNDNIDELLKLVGLDPASKKRSKNFSLGMKQRLAIAIALIGNPEFLVLDEPINGLDPTGIKEVRDTILKLNQERSITILISSHILGELEKLATNYGIIDSGKLIKEFSKDELDSLCKKVIEIKTSELEKAQKLLSTKFSDMEIVMKDDMLVISNHLDNTAEINKFLAVNDIAVDSISVVGQDLEEYFIDIMGGSENA